MSRTSFLFALLLAAASGAAAQTYTGRLAAGDGTLNSGEYRDEYRVEAAVGQRVSATVTSGDFDTYVLLISPSGEQAENDDCTDGDTGRSCATFTADVAGAIRVLVTSYAVGETGDYTLTLSTSGAGNAGPTPSGDTEVGALGAGDETLESGEFFDRYPLRLGAGERVAIEVATDEFDPYLILKSPDGEREENDDCDGDVARSCVEAVASTAGAWEVLVTSYLPEETGRYTMTITRGGAGSATSAGTRREAGSLSPGDETLESGEYVDRYPVRGTGGPLVVDLTTDAFDPYLIVKLPNGEQVDNDDHEGSLTRSLLVVDTEAGADYEVLVTSFAVGETGAYRLAIQADGAAVASGPGAVRRETGALAAGDDRLAAGEYVDKFTFTGVPGQRLRVDLMSDAFDTYLVLDPPRGEAVQDDDGGGAAGHSRIEADLTEPGTYTVYVTSYAADETGPYDLSIDLSERFGTPVAVSDDVASRETPLYSQRSSALTLAETLSGSLDASDQRLGSGEFMEVHTFDGDAGEPVRIELSSSAFDTFLIVESPSGERIENDDFEGDQTRSVVEFAMPEAGRYRVLATSYRAGETGPYTVRVSQVDALLPDPPAYDRIVGLFVGISDYERPGVGDLRWTADDAVHARDAMVRAGMAPGDGVLLTDAEATVANVRAAVRRLAASSNDRTLFVFFYSGHGGQYARSTFQREDPDNLDESIELYDAELLDDDVDVLFAQIPSSRQLIVLDACFSGGFAKDVISRPGRMGLFSSEEDVTSAVAVKFEAGGYLSRFFADAVAEHLADEDSNGGVTALELSHYLYSRFVGDIDVDGRTLLTARDTRPEHQKLVVDRGSVGLYDTLFLFRP